MCGSKYLKVCFIACLFLCINVKVSAQHEQFSDLLLPYYHQAVNYDFISWPLIDMDTLDAQDRLGAIYINSLAATFQTIIKEQDPAAEAREGWERFLDQCDDNDPWCNFIRAEITFQWSLVSFIKGDNFRSFLQFRKVYRAKDDPNQHPWSSKTYGMLNVLLGAVPEQYHWIMSLLGYQSDPVAGISQLEKLIDQNPQIIEEVLITKLMLQQYIFDQNTFSDWLLIRQQNPDSPLVQFLFNTICLKNHKSQYVIELQVDSNIDQVYGQLGEAYLNKLEYDSALIYFDVYEENLEGQMTAEMLHKMWLCHRLKFDSSQTKVYAERLSKKNKGVSEADENAIFNLQFGEEQDLDLMKIRLTTDGGYYDLAEKLLYQLDSASLSGERSQVEYTYRKARLLHLSGQLQKALPYYQIVIDQSPKANWYFAPNTAYQLGLIYEDMGEVDRAVEYYQMVSSYRNYPYRNSLENKSHLRMRIIDSIK